MSTVIGGTDAFALGKSNLNGFLFADIGVEGNGMPLSVISALARQGFDPWQEAERLAGEQPTAAAAELAQLIAALPENSWAMPDAMAAATRLVALLPARAGHAAASVAKRSEAKSTVIDPWFLASILVTVLVTVLATYAAPIAPGNAAAPAPAASPADRVPTLN